MLYVKTLKSVPYLDPDWLEESAEVKVVCINDGYQHRVSKLALAAFSPTFLEALSGTEWEQGEEIVIVTEFDSLRVGEFVDFVHSGRLPSQEELDREDTSSSVPGIHETFAGFGINLSDFIFTQIPIEDTDNDNRDIEASSILPHKNVVLMPKGPDGSPLLDISHGVGKVEVKTENTTHDTRPKRLTKKPRKLEDNNDDVIKENKNDRSTWSDFDGGQTVIDEDSDYKPDVENMDLSDENKVRKTEIKKGKKRKMSGDGNVNEPINKYPRKKKELCSMVQKIKVNKLSKKDFPSRPKTGLRRMLDYLDALYESPEDAFYFPSSGESDRTRPYSCTQCARKFAYEKDLEQHLKRHSRQNDSQLYFCFKCEIWFKKLEDFDTHRVSCQEPPTQGVSTDSEEISKEFQENREHLLHFPESSEKDASHPFKCRLCIREFSKKFNFQQHLLQHHRHVKPEDNDIKQVLACLRCLEKTFASYKELWQHLIACHKVPPRPPSNDILRLFNDNGLDIDSRVLCWVCGSQSRHNQQLGIFHINTCATCDLPYNSWNNHKRHVQEDHGGVMRVRCPQCAEIFQNDAELNRHKKESHAKKRMNEEDYAAERVVSCDQCGIMVKAKYLSHHRRNMHELDFNITCGVCGKTGIRNKAYLQQHMYRNHSGEMKCEKCDFTTTVKLQMKRHMQREHPEPGSLLQCAECDYTHVLESRMKNHIFTCHTDPIDRPFQCDICNKGFGNSGVLKTHMLIHENKRQFKCDKCSAAFNKKVNLTWHIRSVHYGEKRAKPAGRARNFSAKGAKVILG